jgi:hypothetical protein
MGPKKGVGNLSLPAAALTKTALKSFQRLSRMPSINLQGRRRRSNASGNSG